MSFVKHQETVELKINVTVSRRTKNQLEILRRAFERPVQDVAREAFEGAVQAIFDAHMMEVDLAPNAAEIDRAISTLQGMADRGDTRPALAANIEQLQEYRASLPA